MFNFLKNIFTSFLTVFSKIKLLDLFLALLKSEFFIISIIILAIIYPIFFINGSLFLLDYNYGYCLNSSFFSGLSVMNFNLIDFSYRLISYLFGCGFFVRLFVFLSLFVFVYSFYKISFLFTKNKLISLVVAFSSLFTPFIYDRLGIGQIHLILGCGFFILSSYFVFKLFIDKFSFDNKFNFNIVLSFIFASFAFLASPHFIFPLILIFPIGVFLLLKKRSDFFDVLINLFYFFIIFFAINSTVLFGSYSSAYNDYVKNINENSSKHLLPIGDNFGQILFNSLNLSNQFTEKALYNYKSLVYEYPKLFSSVSFIIFFSFLFFGVFVSFKNKHLLDKKIYIYLSLSFLLALVLSFGLSKTIFYDFNKFIFDSIPFYKSMREASKWDIYLILVYAIFVSNALYFIYKNLKPVLRYLLICLFIASCCFKAPYLFFGLNDQIKYYVKPVSADLYSARDYLSSDKKSKVLILPWSEYILPDFLESNDGNVYSIANDFSKFFLNDSYDFSRVNRFPDKLIDDKVYTVNKFNIYDDNFVQYIKYIGFDYIVYIKAESTNIHVVNLKILKSNSRLDNVLETKNVSVFKIK